jgi:hypothetical protein
MAANDQPTLAGARVLADAILRTESILADYAHPGPRSCEAAINQLIETIDREDVIAAAAKIAGKIAPGE